MEGQLEWKERYNVGIEQVDTQHQRLFRIINKLRAVSEDEDKGPWVCQEGIKYFKNYAARHFADEEAYMESISFEGLPVHRRLHEDFRTKRLPALEKELEEANYTKEAIDHLRGICTAWLVEHIQVEDQVIAGNGNSRWASLISKGELDTIGRTIGEKLQEMFEQEPQLLTEYYNGEAFGEGVFFRFSYGTKEKGKQDIILTFEKKLLIHMVEQQVEEQERTGSVMLEIIRDMAEQLEDIQEYFFEGERFEQMGENQLTRDQFRRMLIRQHPRFSLLFDTGKGYFGYCALKSNAVRSDGEAAKDEEEEAAAQNAEEAGKNEGSEAGGPPEKKAAPGKKGTGDTGKVEAPGRKAAPPNKDEAPARKFGPWHKEHAEEQPEKERPRVLVVDDSRMARQVLQDLLQKEYQVTVAKSGISAIRCIERERPDLILLDYNMPVCDGAQMLEMIRTEEDLANVPVIFLTATIDKESVKRVVPLKPSGYLLKSMKPVDIKKKIDQFFAKRKTSV